MVAAITAVGQVSAPNPAVPAPSAAEQLLLAGDKSWRAGSPAEASRSYEQALAGVTTETEPFRSMIILRLSRARQAAGDAPGALKALELLKKLAYVPEHHALAARELEVQIRTGKRSGWQPTPVPAIPAASVVVPVGPRGPSFADALAQARVATSQGKSAEIVLAPGVYPVKEPLALNEQDAGLVLRSKNPLSPAILSGGVTFSSWQAVTDPAVLARIPAAARNQIRVCDMKAAGIKNLELVLGGFGSRRANPKHHPARYASMPVPELIYRGQVQTMARWPKDKLVRISLDKTPPAEQSRYQAWAKESDLWLYGYWKNSYADAYEKVTSIDAGGKVTFAEPTNSYGFGRNMGCAFNALCEITQPGEWQLDTRSGLIYFFPPKDFDPQQCTLSLYGTPITARKCPRLQIRDLKIQDIRGDALVLNDCRDLVVAGVGIRNCSGVGIKVYGGTQHLIHGCTVESMGRGAIDLIAGDWAGLAPANSTIENCRIGRLSRIDHTYSPAVLIEGMGIGIRHNLFEDIPSSAIRIEANDVLVELNIFRHCVYESDDQGAIDMWANALHRGNVIRWNFFDGIIGAPTSHLGAAAIRHDDYISGFMVSENIFNKGSNHGFGAVQYNKGIDNYAEGNIIVDWHKGFTGTSLVAKAWCDGVSAKSPLDKVDWQSGPWLQKYPKLRDLLRVEEKHNYLADNILLGSSKLGAVQHGVFLANSTGDSKFRLNTLADLKPVLPPWRQIPLEQIGPYNSPK